MKYLQIFNKDLVIIYKESILEDTSSGLFEKDSTEHFVKFRGIRLDDEPILMIKGSEHEIQYLLLQYLRS